ncbi:SDR family oxidoreductase [Inquilinus sp. CAU 1745]|uniref:SDR family oxidoreductase n=1 Tax=Inquilinus sp. CAU 1745 TaxID=3140369 RepID=UPI00325B6BB4
MTPRLFCFGLGYSARWLVDIVREEGWSVAGTCRSEEKRAALAAEGIEAVLFETAATALEGATHILVSAPPGEDGDPVLAACRDAIAGLHGLEWLGYLSTTSVYGDHGGAWVTEESALTPATDRGRRRLAAEEGWLILWRDHGVPVHLFRLSGIYGPGRSAIDAVRAGRAKRIDKPGQVFNRIHVADIARTLRASIARPNPGAAYNLADDDPAPSREVTQYACALLGAPLPLLVPFEEAGLSAMARSFYADDKLVSNGRIKRELGVRLLYPGYRDGLSAQMSAGQEDGSSPA